MPQLKNKEGKGSNAEDKKTLEGREVHTYESTKALVYTPSIK